MPFKKATKYLHLLIFTSSCVIDMYLRDMCTQRKAQQRFNPVPGVTDGRHQPSARARLVRTAVQRHNSSLAWTDTVDSAQDSVTSFIRMFKCRSPTKILGLSVDGKIFQQYIQYPLLHNVVYRAGTGQAPLPQLHDGGQEQCRPLQPGDQPAEVREEQEAEAAEGEDQAGCRHCSAPCNTQCPSCRCRGRQVRGVRPGAGAPLPGVCLPPRPPAHGAGAGGGAGEY